MCCTLLTRHSALVLKVSVSLGGKAFKRRLVHSVIVGIAA